MLTSYLIMIMISSQTMPPMPPPYVYSGPESFEKY